MAFESPGTDYREKPASLDDEFVPNPRSTFFYSADSYAMVEIGIFPKTVLVVDRSIHPQNGDVVLAVVQGEHQVRFLKRNAVKGWLVPANRKMTEVLITPEMEVEVVGVVTSYVTIPKAVTYVFSR